MSGIGEPVVEHRATRVAVVAAAHVEQAHRARVALAPAAQRGVDDRLEHRAAGPCADGRASRTPPPLINDSTVRLFSTAGVDAVAEVVEVGERAVSVALLR